MINLYPPSSDLQPPTSDLYCAFVQYDVLPSKEFPTYPRSLSFPELSSLRYALYVFPFFGSYTVPSFHSSFPSKTKLFIRRRLSNGVVLNLGSGFRSSVRGFPVTLSVVSL